MTSRERLTPELGATLLDVARRSITRGVHEGAPLEIAAAAYPDALRVHRATFVTLRLQGSLRGCVGSLVPLRPLVVDVAQSAFKAAFRDYRLPPVGAEELPELDVHISVLGPLEPLQAESEEALLAQLRPRIDGLLLREGPLQGTFLPAVWESLPDPRAFLAELKRKAGLPGDHWSSTLEVHRYEVESIP